MKDLTTFAGLANATTIGSLDSAGSSIDKIYAEAVIANEPTTILEEAGIIRVKKVPENTDTIDFPIFKNKLLTWTEIARSSNDNGIDPTLTALAAVEYRSVTPTVKTAALFIPDTVNLLEPANFQFYAVLGAADAKRKKEQDAIDTLGSAGTITNFFNRTAGGFSTTAVIAGSTLDPTDLMKAKTQLATGSNTYKADFVLMHPNQYEKLNSSAQFSTASTTAGTLMRKAVFDKDGNIIRFNGMDIYVSELLNQIGSGTDTGGSFTVTGHNVIVGVKGLAACRGEKEGLKVSTEDRRTLHGQYKVFDMNYKADSLVRDSVIVIRAAD
jgi:hypothetical protein